jgi:hypothetical protein
MIKMISIGIEHNDRKFRILFLKYNLYNIKENGYI